MVETHHQYFFFLKVFTKFVSDGRVA